MTVANITCKYGSCFTNSFPIAIQIRWKFCFTLTLTLAQWSLQIFVQGTTAVLSWHVQKFVAIGCPTTELQQGEVSIEFELRAKKNNEMSSRLETDRRHTSLSQIQIQTFYCHNHVRHRFNTLRPRQNGCHFADDTFKCIFFNKNVRIAIKISLNFVRKGPINNIPSLVKIMAWCWPGDKPLSEPMMIRLPTHICVTRPYELTKSAHK